MKLTAMSRTPARKSGRSRSNHQQGHGLLLPKPNGKLYNDFLYSIYYDRQLSGDRIAIVDMETETGAGLDYRIRPTGDMYDCLHPYATGYEKMAEEWFLGLKEILPTSRAGSDLDANPGVTVTLDGSGSSDSLASITSYSWKQTAGSPIVVLADANTSRASSRRPM